MKKSRKYLTYAMTGALSLGILGAATIPAFAATNQDGTGDLPKYSELDDATKSKVDEILTNLQQELAELGVSFKGIKGDKFADLDDDSKAKAEAIMDQVKDGTLTRDKANTQLEALGVSLPDHKGFGRGDLFADLDDETKAKAEAIMDQVKDGTLTQEEANTQLEALGVSLPDHKGFGRGDLFADLDNETKAKAEAIMDQVKDGTLTQEEANTQLEALGVSLPDHKGKGDLFEDLDDDTKAKAEAIMDQVKDGSLTRDEANTQLEALGVSLPDHKGKGDKFKNLDDETKEQVDALFEETEEQLDELGVELPKKLVTE